MFNNIILYLKGILLYQDDNSFEKYLHQTYVINNQVLTEEQFSRIHSSLNTSIISKKLCGAFLIGKELHNITLIVSLYSLLIFTIIGFQLVVFYLLSSTKNEHLNEIICYGALPVLAAFFISRGFNWFKKTYNIFSLATFGTIFILAFISIFVFEIPLTIVLFGYFIFFIFFMRGGNNDD